MGKKRANGEGNIRKKEGRQMGRALHCWTRSGDGQGYPFRIFFWPNRLPRSAVLVNTVAVYNGSYTATEAPAVLLDEQQEPIQELVL